MKALALRPTSVHMLFKQNHLRSMMQPSDSAQVAMRIALSGTPGSGKSRLAQELAEDFEILSFEGLAEEMNLLSEVDEDGCREIDIDEMIARLQESWETPPSKSLVIDGHLSHLLPVDAVVVLRAHPLVIDARLHLREYSEEKIRDNVEYEMLSGPWLDMQEIKMPVLELDSGSSSPEECAQSVVQWFDGGCKSISFDEVIDWLDEMASEE